jgi:flagellar motor protein MotB
MSLLLCFFIMLFAISNIIDAKWEAFVQTMEAKMGYEGPSKSPSRNPKPATALASTSEQSRRTASLSGGQPIPGKGETPNVQTIGLKGDVVKGGLIRFEFGRDELSGQAENDLKALFPVLLASSQKIMVKGHVAPTEDEHGIFNRDVDLAYARAVKTMDYLISLGLKKEFFQISVSDSSAIPNRAILPQESDPKLAGASTAIYLIHDTKRPNIEKKEKPTTDAPAE